MYFRSQSKILQRFLRCGTVVDGAYLLRDSPTELPSYSGLNSKRDIFHLDLTRSSGVFGVYQGIGKDLCGVTMRELEQLV